MNLNAHEMSLLVVCLIAFARQQTTPKALPGAAVSPVSPTSPIDGWKLILLAVMLSGLLSFLVGGVAWRELVLRGIQVLVQSVGGIAAANYVIGKLPDPSATPPAPPAPPAS